MDILSQYLEQRNVLKNKLNSLLKDAYTQRNQRLIAVICDEIEDVDYAIAELSKARSDKYGYRPRRWTILSRADFYRAL